MKYPFGVYVTLATCATLLSMKSVVMLNFSCLVMKHYVYVELESGHVELDQSTIEVAAGIPPKIAEPRPVASNLYGVKR